MGAVPEPSQQQAADVGQLREALQGLPPAAAEAILRHVSGCNQALQKAHTEQRMLSRSLAAVSAQLAALPQLQVMHPMPFLTCQLRLYQHTYW